MSPRFFLTHRKNVAAYFLGLCDQIVYIGPIYYLPRAVDDWDDSNSSLFSSGKGILDSDLKDVYSALPLTCVYYQPALVRWSQKPVDTRRYFTFAFHLRANPEVVRIGFVLTLTVAGPFSS